MAPCSGCARSGIEGHGLTHEQVKRQRQLAETVDLSGESDELLPPMRADENRGPQAGPARVKAEVTA